MTEQEVRNLVAKYSIRLVDEQTLYSIVPKRTSKSKMEEIQKEIKSAKPQIIVYLKQQKEEEQKRRAAELERQKKIAGIEGLDYLDHLAHEWNSYSDQQYSYIASGGLKKRPQEPVETLEEASARFPRAAAYRKARGYEMTSNDMKSAAGRKAMRRIKDGEDHLMVIQEMEKEWNKAAGEAVINA